MTAPCRYLPGTTCDRNACDRASSCPGPVDLDAKFERGDRRPGQHGPAPIRETKPAAPPPAREEEETMPAGRPPCAKGKCPLCGEADVKLKVSQKLKGGTGCNRCYKAAQRKEAREGRETSVAPSPAKPATAPRSAPPPAAPKPPPPAPIAKQRPAQAPGAAFSPLTARSLAEALQVEEVRLLVTCRTTAAVLAVVRAAESDQDVMIGVGAGSQG